MAPIDDPLPLADRGPKSAPGRAAAAEERVEELVFEALGVLEESGPTALDTLLEAHPTDASEVRRRVHLLGETGLVAPTPPAPLDLPERIGSYTLGESLGEGGMGVVVEGRDAALERTVAVKLVRPSGLPEAESRARFQREARAAAALSHPGIVRVFDVGEEDGIPWLAMERLDGCTLAEVLQALRGEAPEELNGEHLARAVLAHSAADDTAADDTAPERAIDAWRGPWADVATRIVRDVAEAVQAAHSAGILHRDIKPSNVAVTPYGRVVLLDFGLAHVGEDTRLTRTGALVGSLPYTPPERVREDAPASALGDVYALGVLLYELLALEAPFRATSRSGLVARIAEARPEPIGEVNRAAGGALATVLRRAMHPSPAQRHRSAGDLAQDLDRVLAGQTPNAPGRGATGAFVAWWRTHPFEVLALSAAVLAVACVLPLALKSRAAAAERAAESDARSVARLTVALDATETLQTALPDLPALWGSTYDDLRTRVLSRLVELRAPLLDAPVGAALEPLALRARAAQADALRALDPERSARSVPQPEHPAADASVPELEASLAEVDARMADTPDLIGALQERAAILEALARARSLADDTAGARDAADRAFKDRARLAAAFPGAPALARARDRWIEARAEFLGAQDDAR